MEIGMPQETGQDIASASAALTQIARLAERLATVDARTATEIGVLKEDTRAIRSMFHEANNKMQVLIGAEERFASSIRGVEARFTEQSARMDRIIQIVEDLATARTKAEGAWWLFNRILGIGFILSAISAAASASWFVMSRLSVLLTVKP